MSYSKHCNNNNNNNKRNNIEKIIKILVVINTYIMIKDNDNDDYDKNNPQNSDNKK